MGLIIFGIFFSLLISLYFLQLVVKLATTYFWINIIAGGIKAQNDIIGIAQDPLVGDWIYYLNKQVPEVNIVNITANAAVIVTLVIGLFSYIKHHRVTVHR
ncbi:hypothetical protein [Lederbergia citrea]|uniref:hypothetical protein n=1 Tax=Lederbergia citrea TaxID=2833581 RepID=UPI001BC9E320|nr:hypothetical protein [Lederbergia citrea]MBS4176497.1 hypothetical protein [Lederbergia citrea]